MLLRAGPVFVAVWIAVSGFETQAQSALSFYQDGTQNVVFVGPNQHVYQTVQNGSSWASQDVTAAAGLPLAATGTALSSFASGAIGISFFGVNGHLYDAVYVPGQGWSGDDITVSAGVQPGQTGSAVSTYLDGAQNWVYEGADQHIYQAVFSGAWSGMDVTAASKAPVNAAFGSAISTFVNGNAIGISFFGTDQHLYEAVFANGQWGYAAVDGSAGAPLPAGGSGLSTYLDGAQNWVYQGTDLRIYQITFSGSWSWTNVTADSNLPPAAPGGAISSFVQGGAISISFFDASRNLWEAVFVNGQWSPGVNLTAAGNAPPAESGSGLTSYVTSSQNWVYEAASGVLLINFNGSWTEVNLSAVSGLQWITTPAKEYVYFNGQAVAIENNPK